MEHKTKKELSFAFFGTPVGAVEILDILHSSGYAPSLIVTNPDRPQGRRLAPTPPPVKVWAQKNGIRFLQPEKLNTAFNLQLSTYNFQLFIVVAYGTLLPKEILSIPKCGTLNIHYSLLPKYRGATPIESQILADDKDVGVSLILVDEKMDHGPIVAQKKIQDSRFKTKEWPPKASELRTACNKLGAELLIETIPLWMNGKIKAMHQDSAQATYTRKFPKTDGEINLSDDPYKNYLKICAFDDSIGTYFFAEKSRKKIRVIIRDAKYENGKLILTRVVPESKKEMSYNEFLRGLK